jgi:hypothetical protein
MTVTVIAVISLRSPNPPHVEPVFVVKYPGFTELARHAIDDVLAEDARVSPRNGQYAGTLVVPEKRIDSQRPFGNHDIEPT